MLLSGRIMTMRVLLKEFFRVVLLVAVSGWAQAERVVDLYQSKVLVSSQRVSERNQAATDALAEVIVRVSGQVQSLQNPQIIAAISRPQNFIHEFSYESTEETLEVNGRELPASKLILTFSPRAIEGLLRQSRQSIWPANRPSMLVWLVVDDVNHGRQMTINGDTQAALEAAVVRRGLPVVTPLLDLQDQIALTADDLWTLNEPAVRSASLRYGADSILVGRYSQTSRGQWRATWQLLHKQDSVVFDSYSEDLTQLFGEGIDQVADYLAGLYAIVPQDGETDALVMQVAGVEDFGTYVDVLDYLDGLAVVRRAALVTVREQTLWLHLYTDGDLSLLLDALMLDKKLSASSEQGSVSLPGSRHQLRGTEENPLHFYWQG